MKHEIKVFFTALMFYSRIPCPSWVDHSAEMLNKATRYFPFIGWLVAVISGIVLYGFAQFLPFSLAILLSMVGSILVTGAFHEDGLADVCDGFGGGWTKKRILDIMKDSVIGAYGVVGLVLILLIKFFALQEMTNKVSLIEIMAILITAHALSRFMAVILIKFYDYARANEDSKAKPVAKRLPGASFVVAATFGLAPLIYFQSFYILLTILPPLVLTIYLGRYFKKWIGGYTGDCLGATQQVTEVVFYLSCIGLWKFI